MWASRDADISANYALQLPYMGVSWRSAQVTSRVLLPEQDGMGPFELRSVRTFHFLHEPTKSSRPHTLAARMQSMPMFKADGPTRSGKHQAHGSATRNSKILRPGQAWTGKTAPSGGTVSAFVEQECT